MSVVGFDLGNENCVVAVARQRGIDVVLNQESKRETPAVVSFGEKQRLIGSAGSASAVMNPRNSITQIKRLIGRRFSEISPEIELFPFSVKEGHDGFPLINVRYLGKERAFTPTQVLGMVLSNLKVLAEKHLKAAVVDCCIGIPAYFTDLQRRAVLDAARIAGLHLLRLIHETSATALEYGIYRTDLPEKGQMNVAFVDVGHASMQVCIAGYRKGQLRVLAHAFDQSLGGRDFDEVLFSYFAAKFKERTGIDISSNARACIRLRAACEKSKKMLSANPEAPLNVECLVNDEDFRGFIRREEFEQISDPILQRVKRPLEEALVSAGLSVEDIHAIEVVGSGSRVPAIIRILTDFFRKEPRRTMNASECVARGCALQCAILSPTFKVREFEVHENFPFAVDVLWKSPSSVSTNFPEGVEVFSPAFSKGDPIPNTKTLRLFGEDSFPVDLVYSDASEMEKPRTIRAYKIGPCQLTKGEIAAFEIEVSLNLHGIVSMCSATIVKEVEVPTSTKVTIVAASEVESNSASDWCKSTENHPDLEVDTSKSIPQATVMGSSGVESNSASDQCKSAQNHSELKVDGMKSPQVAVMGSSEVGSNHASNQCTSTKNLSELEVDGLSSTPQVAVMGSSEVMHQISVEVAKENKRISISFSECIHDGISPTYLEKLIEEELEMALQDRVMEETKDMKNSVETYVYDMRNKISDKYKDFVTDLDRKTFSEKLQETEDWLYDEGGDATKAVYIKKLEELKVLSDPIEKRYIEDTERARTANMLYQCICSFGNAVQTNDPQLDHIDIAEKQKVLDACNQAHTWLNDMWQRQSALPKYANPVVSSAELMRYSQDLDSYCKKIVLKPRPVPVKMQTSSKETPKPQPVADPRQTAVGNGNGMKQPSVDENHEPPIGPANGENSQSAQGESA